MGGTVNAAEAAVRNAQGSAQGAAAEQQQGVLGGRQVSDQQRRAAGLSLRERQEDGAVGGDAAAQRSLRTRQAAVGGASDGRGNTDILSRFLVTPDLEPTVLTNAQGVTLFRGLRHGLLATCELSLQLLQSLPDDQLTSFFEKTDPWQDRSLTNPSDKASRIRMNVRGLRLGPECAEGFAQGFRLSATDHMAREVAAAALATDTAKCEQALNGGTPVIHLCAVSLLKPVESENSHLQQVEGLDELVANHPPDPPPDRDWPLVLKLSDPVDGERRSANVRINIRQFALSSFGDGGKWVSLGGDPHRAKRELEQLVGPIEDDRLVGHAGERARAIVEQSRSALAANRVAIATEFQSPTKKFHTLTEASAQLKAMWTEHGNWPAGADGHLRAAALILLIAYNMGEAPLLSGTDTGLTERLDAEVKCLATYADSHEGHLPPFDSRVQE
ncbi:MAG: hypothetical protein OXE40_08115 [Gammaproteobacteria bacterium]|nr:hypothetical protein [Gammaproteobacteria bacterium]